MNEGLLFYFDSVYSWIEQLKYKVHEAEAEHLCGGMIAELWGYDWLKIM